MLSFLDLFLNYLSKSSLVTIFVLSWLSLYFIISFTILFSRYTGLNTWKKKEQAALESILMGAKVSSVDSSLKKCALSFPTKEKLDVCISLAETNATSGLTMLSIIASTSPFIGLFGTVVSILETFAGLGQGGGSSSLSVIAPAISEALVATGCGIFVAIPAYSFNLLIKRKAYEILSIIRRESNILLSTQEETK
ncbi:MotA/TolQ/ExbB proton channel family protein [Campylobacter hyointestinalis]|uniref:MotA/TolQ/ExbB proton channel family protein n=1 Tax=Campylobacter hyointestinalis TaxID=198 RepID=A0A562XLQ8_CAMHY|nr:MotA/TolQ/ExbB proton channel family protein [Campylobacter hyointestinalis]ANE34898.1 Tol-Pal system subunit TolQ [Campylobacter hyointestinalis subsp. lawsonii CCUG 27631]RAZ22863.1 MotA/TolQ/ExbB proton channel family protein [Campylobacter hyointestinalis subsp. lawsonii]RAZ38206.1 MotA/TolQ/ExbB proton channel family protein [Campylobacter hyointestinalis subsp. lawsonii]RAZ50543.1 MotA/TolQ/ExbB proton channel family protein [Campylobacter hyointestinalis subsp. lawsonii]RAZ51399.1 Mo